MSPETSSHWTEVQTLAGGTLRFHPTRPLERRIADVAAAQHGVVSVRQLERCGLSASAARSRVASGALHRLHRGVFCPGQPRLPGLGLIAAAVLACGPGAVASHLTAAALHDLRSGRRGLVDVTVAGRTGRRHGSIVTHSAATLRPEDVTVVEGIPVTAVPRTALDCARRLGRRGTEKLCREAELVRTFDLRAMRSILAHVPGHAGAATLTVALEDLAGSRGSTASAAEDLLLAAFRAAGMPEPECNAALERPDGSWAHADFLWRAERLIVEADPIGTHDRTANYRSDRRRDRSLLQIGYETLRFSDQDMRNPAECAAEAALHLERRRVTGSVR